MVGIPPFLPETSNGRPGTQTLEQYLNVGCGPGNPGAALAQQCARVTALDFSRAMLDILEKRAQNPKAGRTHPYLSGCLGG